MADDTVEGIFRAIHCNNGFGGSESVSGPGSSLDATTCLRAALPPLLAKYDVHSVVDAGCGDLNWLREINLDVQQYIGVDVVEELVEKSRQAYGSNTRRFVVLNLCEDPLPYADAILCRDCLVHLPTAKVMLALSNFRRSGAKYLFATTFPGISPCNADISCGSWRPTDLEAPPFELTNPLEVINEGCRESGFETKSMGVWKLQGP